MGRSAHRLLLDTVQLYRRFPHLFFVLAAAVVVPYELIVLAAVGTDPAERSSFGAGLFLLVMDLALVGPLVSALHVHAVGVAREGEEPRLGQVARRGLKALPVVAMATVASWLGILVGFLLLIVPGVLLFLRWCVVAQVAAVEGDGWSAALRRSGLLTDGRYWHILAFIVYVGIVVSVPALLVRVGLGDSVTAASFAVNLIVKTLLSSFSALALALLYFELRERWEYAAAAEAASGEIAARSDPEPVSSWDPRDYPDENRPRGWYVDPQAPERMRFWSVLEPYGWGATTKTPRKIRTEWDEAEQRG